MEYLYIILAFNHMTSVYDGENHIELYGINLNGKRVDMHYGGFDELEKILNVNVTKYKYKRYTYNVYFELTGIINVINEIIKRGEYTIVSISENKDSMLKYHFVKNNNKAYKS